MPCPRKHRIDNLKEGDLIKTLPPTGRFTINSYNNDLFCFVVAGSGIVPVYSLIKHLLNHLSRSKILIIFQNRNEQTAIFRKQLLLFIEGFPGTISLIELFSQPLSHHLHPKRLNNFLLEQLIQKHVQTLSVQFYICGPPLFMKMAEFTLKMLGYDATGIIKEIFVIDAPPAPQLMIDANPRNVTIHSKHNIYELKIKYPQNILQAALEQDVNLPFSCRGGRCSSCTVRLLSGKIKMSMNDVLTEKDLEAGLVLTCFGYAETDVVLQVE